MDKKRVFDQFIEVLEENLSTLVRSARDAKKFATDKEAKAENKYDTKGLEASYLAGAQAKRAKDFADKIAKLKAVHLPEGLNKIQAYALFSLLNDDNSESQYYFVLPQFGGWSIESGGVKITSLSLDSPLLKKLLAKESGDFVDFQKKTFEIEEVL